MFDGKGLVCFGLVLLASGCVHSARTSSHEPTERTKGGDSATLHIQALIARGQLSEAEALLVEAIAAGLVSQEAATRMKESIRQRQRIRQSGPESPPVTPLAGPEDPSGERRTCAAEFPVYPTCQELPEEYTYPGAQQALEAMKQRLGTKNLVLHNSDTARVGPCPGMGDHYNVRSNGERTGSIACCPCCVDAEAVPLHVDPVPYHLVAQQVES